MNRLAERLEKLAQTVAAPNRQPRRPLSAPSCAPRCPASCSLVLAAVVVRSRSQQARLRPIPPPRAARPGLAVRARSARTTGCPRTGRAAASARPGSRRRSRTSSTRARWSQLFKGTVGWYRVGFTGPPTADGLQLVAALRAGAPHRARVAQRPRDRRAPRPVHAVRAARRGPARGPAEPARRARRQPPPAGHARGLVELGRHHARGLARPRAARRAARRRRAAAPPLRGARSAAGRRSSTAGSRTAAPRSQTPAVRLTLRSPDGTPLGRRRAARGRCGPASACACATRCPCAASRSLWEPEQPAALRRDRPLDCSAGATDPDRPAAHRAAHASRSSTARCASTTACSTCAARRSRRTSPAAAPR